MNEINISISWERVKEKIFLRMVNYEKNKAEIKERVYVSFLDLAILLYCDCEEWGLDGFYVSENQLLMWKQDIKSVFRTALENTYCENNTLVVPMLDLLPLEMAYVVQMEMENMNMEEEIEMMVLTNQSIHFGVAMLLNIPELKKLADWLESDLYLIPSSVHEILAICSDQDTDLIYLTNMVNEVNNEIVRDEDYLSDHVYYFSMERCEVTIAVPA